MGTDGHAVDKAWPRQHEEDDPRDRVRYVVMTARCVIDRVPASPRCAPVEADELRAQGRPIRQRNEADVLTCSPGCPRL